MTEKIYCELCGEEISAEQAAATLQEYDFELCEECVRKIRMRLAVDTEAD